MSKKAPNASEPEFMQKLSAPAQRALLRAGITSLQTLSLYSEKELLALHGFGPASIPVLEMALAKEGLTLKKQR